MRKALWAVGPALLLAGAVPAGAVTIGGFGPGGQIRPATTDGVVLGSGGDVFQLDAFVTLAGSDLNGAGPGSAARVGTDPLPAGLGSGFTFELQDGATDLLLRYELRNDTGGPLPGNLPEQLIYSGVGDWITLSAGAWGHGFANLKTRQAVIILSQVLAAEPRLVSRYFIDHYLLNFILTEWAMLHASCVLDPQRQRLLVMIGPHNAGKSTTALRLLRAGYIFLADGMALLRRGDDSFRVGGYPIGEVKLRDDVLASFPEYTGQRFKVREQHKTVVNLRAAHPERIVEQIIRPPAIQLCLVERRDTARTDIAELSPADFLPQLAAHTVYWDEPRRLAHNSATLQALLQAAGLYRLSLGREPDGIVAAIEALS